MIVMCRLIFNYIVYLIELGICGKIQLFSNSVGRGYSYVKKSRNSPINNRNCIFINIYFTDSKWMGFLIIITKRLGKKKVQILWNKKKKNIRMFMGYVVYLLNLSCGNIANVFVDIEEWIREKQIAIGK